MQKQHSELVNKLMKPGQDILDSLDAHKCDMIHNVLGMVGEIHEVKIAATENQGLDNLIKELGDFEFYFEGFVQCMGRKKKIPKLSDDAHPTYTLQPLIDSVMELAELVKKWIVREKPVNLVPQIEKIENALANFYAVVERASNPGNSPDVEVVTRDVVLKQNIEKLNKRFPGGKYTNKDAIDRKDKK